MTHTYTYAVFKETREQRGLSLSDVANALHLTVTVIEQIEAGDFVHRHLAPVFMRGYVRSYAKHLNLPEDVVNEIVSTLDATLTQTTTEKSKLTLQKPAHHYNIKKILSYLLVVIILIIAASFWHSANQPTAPQTIDNIQPSITVTTQPNQDNSTQPQDENPTPALEEDTATQSEEETPAPLENTVTPPEAEQIPPAIIPMPEPKLVPPPKRIISAPITTPTQPEVVDAQEAP